MAGSVTPALAAAVGNAGGLGSLGCATMSLDDLRTKAGELRAAELIETLVAEAQQVLGAR